MERVFNARIGMPRALALIVALGASCAPGGSTVGPRIGDDGLSLPSQATPQGGGQSGTDSSGTGCKNPPPTPVSPAMLAGAPEQIRARIERATAQNAVL